MALIGTNRGAGRHTTSAISVACSPTSDFVAGSTAVLCLSYDNSGASGADPFVSIADSKGNRWASRQVQLHDPGAASAGITLRIFEGLMADPLTPVDAVTVTFSVTTTAKAWAFHEITRTTRETTPVYQTGGVLVGGSTTTPSLVTAALTAGDMVIGAGAAEAAETWTGDADTTAGAWSAAQETAAGSGTSGASLTTQRKIVTANATQTYNPTLSASADRVLAWASWREVAITWSEREDLSESEADAELATRKDNPDCMAWSKTTYVRTGRIDVRWAMRQ